MIRVTCPNCQSKLNAKDGLEGQTRKCPKCAQTVLIVADPPAVEFETPEAPSSDAQPFSITTGERLPTPETPERLNRECHYLICDKTRVVATWENDGKGWLYMAGNGFISAKRCRESLPSQGDFQLVELKFARTDEGKRLSGMTFYQLATRWALTTLDQGDDAIAAKIAGPGSLNRDQKNSVRQALKDQFMRDVWADATEVVEYLGNADFHSSGVG